MVRSAFVFLLLWPTFTSAQVIISEIMYDLAEGSDSGREWIEVYNAGATPMVFTELTLFESNRKHGITGETKTVPPNTFAVIVDKPEKFRADYPTYTGLIFDSAFSLNNEGEALDLRRGEGVLDTASYEKSLGGNGSGESIQRTALARGATFAPGAPTPGTGVPTNGLVRIAAPSKKTKAATSKTTAAAPAPTPQVLGTNTAHESFETFEVPIESPSMTLWLLGAAAIAGVGITGAVLGRKRDEIDDWTIIEET